MFEKQVFQDDNVTKQQMFKTLNVPQKLNRCVHPHFSAGCVLQEKAMFGHDTLNVTCMFELFAKLFVTCVVQKLWTSDAQRPLKKSFGCHTGLTDKTSPPFFFLQALWVLQRRKLPPSHKASGHHLLSHPSSPPSHWHTLDRAVLQHSCYLKVLCRDTCFIQVNCYFSSSLIAIVSSSEGFCVCVYKCVHVGYLKTRVCSLVKDDRTKFCKKNQKKTGWSACCCCRSNWATWLCLLFVGGFFFSSHTWVEKQPLSHPFPPLS